MRSLTWQIKNKETATIANVTSILASNRGLKTKESLDAFLNPSLESLLNWKMDDIHKAILRIEKAIKSKEKVVIYSDYDADGINGTAILWEVLNSIGAEVMPYIPDRITEGYGFSSKAIEKLFQNGVKLIISVDHGITAVDEVSFAQSLGIDVILTDHHVVPQVMPKPYALVHTTDLCGAGVAWKLAWEIGKHFKIEKEEIFEKLTLAAIATVADLVPLTGYNRAIVKFGLEALRRTKRPGLLAIFHRVAIDRESVGVYEIGHLIAPRINAMGRIDHAMDSLRLLCTRSPLQAAKIAQLVSETNSKRQNLTVKASDEAMLMVEESSAIGIVVSSEWHEGVIGLVAGRVVERYWRPAIAIAQGGEFSKGSARSVEGFNMVEALRTCTDILVNVGGHPMAAGFTIRTDQIEIFKNRMLTLASKKIDVHNLERSIKIDCPLKLSEVSWEIFEQIQRFEPFGVANEEPIFLAKGTEIGEVRTVGSLNQHLKLTVEKIDAIGFGMGERKSDLRPGNKFDLVYTLGQNIWNGKKSLQLKIKDFK